MLLVFCVFFLLLLPTLRRLSADFGSDGLNVIFNVGVLIALMVTVGFLVWRIGIAKKRNRNRKRIFSRAGKV